MIKRTLGGDRLGSGPRMEVEMHNYGRSTHNLSKKWRSTMASGTLVPFMKVVALPGDTWDINLMGEINTHPTIGPLFGGYKWACDVFVAPMRLYQGLLHNNEINLGLNMNNVYWPILQFEVDVTPPLEEITDLNNSQINPSCILHYLGVHGLGINRTSGARQRQIQCVPYLAYLEIYKNYYANKQEENGYVIHTPAEELIESVDEVNIKDMIHNVDHIVPEGINVATIDIGSGYQWQISYTTEAPKPNQIIINTDRGDIYLDQLAIGFYDNTTDDRLEGNYDFSRWGNIQIKGWRYRSVNDLNTGKPSIAQFPLENIDLQRKGILRAAYDGYMPYDVSNSALTPYIWLTEKANGIPNTLSSQEGLLLKTYQSDIFNNWLNEESISTIGNNTAIDVSGGLLYIDALILQRKTFDIMNRIAVSGATTDDWIEVVYGHEAYRRAETPMYMGGMVKELMFQEVVSTGASGDQPLGTLAGKGVLTSKHKGGHISIKTDEPSYIIGITSLTPRVDYSQGNHWDIELKTMDDLHKPGLDEIGFQDLSGALMAWWDTYFDEATNSWKTHSRGKQPAWINYMTDFDETHGNFAIEDNEMFMTLNRRYEPEDNTTNITIKDWTAYIDPSKYNFIFAETQLDAQNFWVQIGMQVTVRRKMSARIMPNL